VEIRGALPPGAYALLGGLPLYPSLPAIPWPTLNPEEPDILAAADGIDTDDTIARAQSIQLGDLPVFVVSLADLMANKMAAGRPQDLADVAALQKCQRIAW